MDKNPWVTVKENIIYTNKFGYTLKDNDVITPAGKPGKFMVLEHTDYAAIVPITSDGNLVMVKQWRYSIGKQTLEIPAGGGNINEEPLLTAKRELLEETGASGDNWKLLSEFWTANGCAKMKGRIFLATDVQINQKAHNDDTETTEVELVPFEKAVQMVKNQEFDEGRTIMGILLAKEALGQDHQSTSARV